ncbi:MAG: MBL fold metallo-hydrolase [Bacteriovoracaceae bacterium]|nr:MBL fold metallo-hydrolase [Bacteriovoracaceae bacterium]
MSWPRVEYSLKQNYSKGIMMSSIKLSLQNFFHKETYTHSYVVFDTSTRDALIIDPVLDYDQASSTISSRSAKILLDFCKENKLKVQAILETHAHADHMTAAQWLKKRLPQSKVAIGKNITKVQETFKAIYNLDEMRTDGSDFDILLDEKILSKFGSIEVKTIFTPGHTPACSTYAIGQYLFVGDALFMPDYGTGRCDFPDGSSDDLFDSITNKLYKLDLNLIVCTGHDYGQDGREICYRTTIAEQLENNIQLNKNTTCTEFVGLRNKRDMSLNVPRLQFPSIQFNIRAGNFAPAEANGKKYLKIPIQEIKESDEL